MIQELLGGSSVGLIGGERSKFSSPPCGGILDHSSPSHNPPSPSSSSGAPTAVSVAATSENLRCPRCDSSNTKFCYYNNYNLTQPRHFCKTCRRYWTKGGALRNVPIGGGCRKNKNATITASKSSTSAAGKMKTPAEMAKVGLFSGFDQVETLSSNPIIWASSQNSHFLSLFRPNQNQNPNPNHLQMINSVKEEAGNGMFFTPPHMTSDHASRALGFDPLGPAHLYRNQSLPSHQGIIHGEIQNNGLQELYQRLRSSPACYPDHTPLILGNMGSANSTILESAPVAAGDQLGFSWNNTLSWPTDLPTTNGAYP